MMSERHMSQCSASPTGAAHHHSGEEMSMKTEQEIADAYTMIRAAIRLADKLEQDPAHHGDSATVRQLAEYLERTVVPINQRR